MRPGLVHTLGTRPTCTIEIGRLGSVHTLGHGPIYTPGTWHVHIVGPVCTVRPGLTMRAGHTIHGVKNGVLQLWHLQVFIDYSLDLLTW